MTPHPSRADALAKLRAQQEETAAALSEFTVRALSRVATLTATRDRADRELAEAVRYARGAGASWADIGKAAGTSRQNAAQRWGRTSTAADIYAAERAVGDGTGPTR